MIKASDILGMNAREQLYTPLNSAKAKKLCSDKYSSKQLLIKHQIPTAKLYGVLITHEDIEEFDWQLLEKNFVIKPTNGNAGKGVVAFKSKINNDNWVDVMGNYWSLNDLKLHCFNIMEGQYSTYGRQHHVIIEERILIHPKLLKYTYRGTPDIRVLVYNQVPVIALLRLPTKESEGRANQSQGAIGVGVDMATGITTYAAAHKNQLIRYLPGTKKKLNGIKIPYWHQVLTVAVDAAQISGLAYAGIDLFVHKTKGPMVVEINANPGLSIQVANKAGLRRRLERIAGLQVRNTEHGVKIAQALFAEKFADVVKSKQGLSIINTKEQVIVFGDHKQKVEVLARINTGRYRSAIALNTAQELGLVDRDDLLWYQNESEEGKVPVIKVKLKIADRIIDTTMIVSKSLNRGLYRLHLGRNDLAEFLVRSNS